MAIRSACGSTPLPIEAELLSAADSACVALLSPSPNHDARGGSGLPDCIILHYTGMADGASALAWLCNPASKVSCHYVVALDGSIIQLVAERRRAWHAGRGQWQDAHDLNTASIGIEIVNGGHDYGLPPYPAAQVEAVIGLVGDIARRHEIAPERILAHSDIAPSRKRDPGEHFPWHRLAEAGLGAWVPEPEGLDGSGFGLGASGPEVAELQADLARYGYGIDVTGVFDAATEIVLRAFQRHFRQRRVDGIADAGTRATLQALLSNRAVCQPQ